MDLFSVFIALFCIKTRMDVKSDVWIVQIYVFIYNSREEVQHKDWTAKNLF